MGPFAFDPDRFTKLVWGLPWIVRYPFWRARQTVRSLTEGGGGAPHLIFIIANHFEPAYNVEPNEYGGLGIPLSWDEQAVRLERWCKQARAIGTAVTDHDGTPLRHTNFYPAEQYHAGLLDQLAELQADGFGEAEIHLHHGIEAPDTPENTRRALVEFRDTMAEKHKLLSRFKDSDLPRYAFVHGNWALANSNHNRYCGVDSEMQILAETGCYADLTLPSAPDRSQVSRINALYQCGLPMDQPAPHRCGPDIKTGDQLNLPIILGGPLIVDFSRRRYGIPIPRLDTGVLSQKYPLNVDRLDRWRSAAISVRGRPDWVFVKLYCHGFFPEDESVVIGEDLRKFFADVIELGERTGQFRVHFATAREAFNMVQAAVEGYDNQPGQYRDFALRQIMFERPDADVAPVVDSRSALDLVNSTALK